MPQCRHHHRQHQRTDTKRNHFEQAKCGEMTSRLSRWQTNSGIGEIRFWKLEPRFEPRGHTMYTMRYSIVLSGQLGFSVIINVINHQNVPFLSDCTSMISPQWHNGPPVARAMRSQNNLFSIANYFLVRNGRLSPKKPKAWMVLVKIHDGTQQLFTFECARINWSEHEYTWNFGAASYRCFPGMLLEWFSMISTVLRILENTTGFLVTYPFTTVFSFQNTTQVWRCMQKLKMNHV